MTAKDVENGKAGTCPVCGRIIRVRKARNGSTRILEKHVQSTIRPLPCRGSGRAAKEGPLEAKP